MRLTPRDSLRGLAAAAAIFGLAACSAAPVAATTKKPARTAEETPEGADREGDADKVDADGPSSPSVIGSATVVDLGAVSAGTKVTLDVPPTALGFNIVVESSDSLGIQKIEAPGGDVVHDGFMPKNGSFPTSEGVDGAASASVPANDLTSTVPLATGKWTITFGGSGERGHAKARIQTTGDGQFHGGILDLHVHVATGVKLSDPSPSHVVDAPNAAKDPDVIKRVDGFFAALKRGYDIDRGKVTFHVAPAALRTLTTDAAITAASSVAKGSPEAQALHVVLTNAIGSGDDEAMGLSPGIPGAAIVTGTSMSAVMLAHYDDVDAATEALTLLHEMGHFVGLQHTSEYSGDAFDPLSDTPKCVGTRTETSKCPDDGNIMFTGSFPAAPLITAGQKAIFRASPIYRAYPSNSARDDAAQRPSQAAEAFDFPVVAARATSRRLCAHTPRR